MLVSIEDRFIVVVKIGCVISINRYFKEDIYSFDTAIHDFIFNRNSLGDLLNDEIEFLLWSFVGINDSSS